MTIVNSAIPLRQTCSVHVFSATKEIKAVGVFKQSSSPT